MKQWLVSLCFSFCIISCHTWQDKDLYIAEVFINPREEVYLILKNQGNTIIEEQGIDLVYYWDHQSKVVINLDSIDPHFRKPGDSSIIRLDILPRQNSHRILARIDPEDKVAESDEDHNTYSKTLMQAVDAPVSVYQYPAIHKTFEEKTYRSYFSQGRFAELVIWRVGGKQYKLSQWPSVWKEQLLEHIRQIYTNSLVIYPDTVPVTYTSDEAFDLYLGYIAHSLYVEQEHLVPWSVNDFNPTALSELWDGAYFFYWDSLNQIYALDYTAGGGIQLVHPVSTYLFARGIQPRDLYGTADQTIHALVQWSRAYLLHTENSSKIRYQSVPTTWYPIKGEVHSVTSCWAMGGLMMEYARALNLPIQRRQIDLHNGLHTLIRFPAMGKTITHADDIYDPLFYPVYQDIPATSMMMTDDETDQLLKSRRYCIQDSCHTIGTQHTYDRRKLLMQKALNYGSGFLYLQHDSGKSTFKSYLRGDEFYTFLKPIYTDDEIKEIEASLYQSRPDESMILNHYRRYEACKSYRR